MEPMGNQDPAALSTVEGGKIKKKKKKKTRALSLSLRDERRGGISSDILPVI